jgi:hypothetical protein
MKKYPVLLGALLFTNIAFSNDPVFETADRCNEDSLHPVEAIGRVLWAKKCSKIGKHRANAALYNDDDSPKDKPSYPIWVTDDYKITWKEAPKTETSDCVDIPAQFTKYIMCTSSCYTPDQRLAFVTEEETLEKPFQISWIPIVDAYMKQKRILALDPASTLENIMFSPVDVKGYTREYKDVTNKIVAFKLESGGKLKVTPNHPIVSGTGHIREASAFKVGDYFIKMDGSLDKVAEIEDTEHFGRVYNVDTKSSDLKKKIVLAEGYLNGTSYYQNDGFKYINRQLFREQFNEELLP